MKFNAMMARSREKSWVFLLVLILVSTGMSMLNNLVFFRYGTFSPIYEATNGLIGGTLIASGLHGLVIVLGLLMLVGRMRASEFGVVTAQIGQGVFVLALVWLALNVISVVVVLVTGQALSWDSRWAEWGVLAVLGSLIGQVFGNALVEEIQYRGFLLPQFWHKLRALADRPRLRVVLAVALMGAIFSLSHIPNRIVHQQPFDDWAMLFGMGALFALIYLRTENLFVAVALHALHNAPTLLFASPLDYALPIMVLDALVVVFWPQIAGFYGRLFGQVDPVGTQVERQTA